jgi:molybdopterin/thiamine biosynthesis adenylyltransferase
MSAWDRVERLIGAEALERLHASHVAVVGLGSGGGFVALSLAMSGVGRFTLVDMEPLEPQNLVRHVADARYLGVNKAAAVADLIRHRNTDAVVRVIEGDIAAHPEALDGANLLIVGVDGEQTKYKLNELALARSLPAVYAGVYARGEGGDVCVIRPYDGPCYACWAAELREGIQTGPVEELDYGQLADDKGALAAEPGLWLHVVRIAAAQADLALALLLPSRPPLPANTLVLANAALEIIEGQVTPPHGSLWVNIARDPNCLVCGDRLQAAATISLDDLAAESHVAIETEADESARRLNDD